MPPEPRELTTGDPVAPALLNWINWAAVAIMAWHRGELADAERLARTATLRPDPGNLHAAVREIGTVARCS
jgi:hypothetical protein